MSYEIDGRMLIIHQDDETGLEIISSVLSQALIDPALVANTCILWDATKAPAQASPEKMIKMLTKFPAVSKKIQPRFAILVESGLQFGVSRMLNVYARSFSVEVESFYDIALARSWLVNED